VGEHLNEEELAIFDLLTKPQIELSDSDREEVKATARDLLNTLKAWKLVLDWRKRQQARAEVRITIEKMLDHGTIAIVHIILYKKQVLISISNVRGGVW